MQIKQSLDKNKIVDSQSIKQSANEFINQPKMFVSEDENYAILAQDSSLIIIQYSESNSKSNTSLKKELKLDNLITVIDVYQKTINNKLQIALSLNKSHKIQVLYIEYNIKILIREFQTQHWHSTPINQIKFNNVDSFEQLRIYSGGSEHTLVCRHLQSTTNTFLSRIGEIQYINPKGNSIIVRNVGNRIMLIDHAGDNLAINKYITLPNINTMGRDNQRNVKLTKDFILVLAHPTQIDFITYNFELKHQLNNEQSQNVIPNTNNQSINKIDASNLSLTSIYSITDQYLFLNSSIVTLEVQEGDMFKSNVMNVFELVASKSNINTKELVQSVKFPLEYDVIATSIKVIHDNVNTAVFAIYSSHGFIVYKLQKIFNDEVFKYTLTKSTKFLDLNSVLLEMQPLANNMIISLSKEQLSDETDLSNSEKFHGKAKYGQNMVDEKLNKDNAYNQIIKVHDAKGNHNIIHIQLEEIYNIQVVKEFLYITSKDMVKSINLLNKDVCDQKGIKGNSCYEVIYSLNNNIGNNIILLNKDSNKKDKKKTGDTNQFQNIDVQNSINSNSMKTIKSNNIPLFIQSDINNVDIFTMNSELITDRELKLQKHEIDLSEKTFKFKSLEIDVMSRSHKRNQQSNSKLKEFFNNDQQIDLNANEILENQFEEM